MNIANDILVVMKSGSFSRLDNLKHLYDWPNRPSRWFGYMSEIDDSNLTKSGLIVNYDRGFTIVELLIVIVIIGILAAITVVSYVGISQRSRDSTLKSDLTNSATLMQLDYVTNGSVSSVFPSGVKVSPGVGMSLSSTATSTGFCVNGQMTNGNSITYMYYDSIYGATQTGACSGSVIYGSELGMPHNLVLDDSFSNISGTGWFLNIQNPSGTTITTRPGTLADPIPNKTVIIVTNSVARTTAWSLLSGTVMYASLTNGNTYKRTIWARMTGSYVGPVSGFGVLDGNGLNVTLSTGPNLNVTTAWQQISSTTVAARDGTASNLLYLPFNTAAFASAGWTLEFQCPQLFQQ